MARPDYRVEIDASGTGTYTDVSDLVEDIMVSWGTDAATAVDDVTFRTARGHVRLLNNGAYDSLGIVPIRIRDGGPDIIAWQGRAVPSQHESLNKPDFYYWALEGLYAPDLRQTHDYFIQPQAEVGQLGPRDIHVFCDLSDADTSTSYIVGEMTPAQLLNRLGPLAGGYMYEGFDGFIGFSSLRKSFERGATALLPATLGPLPSSSVYVNRQTVRTRTIVRGTNYQADPNNPVPVGLQDFNYRQYAYTPPLSFKPAADRTLRIDEWIVPSAPDDVPVVIQGGGGRYSRVRAPITGLAGTAELFYVPFIPAAGTRLQTEFAVLFSANVSRLRSFDIRTAQFAEAVETHGSVDANLAPWATQAGFLDTIKPWLEIRSQPLTFVDAHYEEEQAGTSSLGLMRRAQPGAVMAIEFPKPDGGSVIHRTLVLGVTLAWSRDTIPVRRISGVSSGVSAPVQTFTMEAEAFGPFDARITVEIPKPDSTKNAYARYRKTGDSAWTTITALGQDTEVVFGINGLEEATQYEAEAGLEADYSDALADTFLTDTSPETAFTCTFDLLDEDGAAITNAQAMILFEEHLAFLVITDDGVFHQFDAGGNHVRQNTFTGISKVWSAYRYVRPDDPASTDIMVNVTSTAAGTSVTQTFNVYSYDPNTNTITLRRRGAAGFTTENRSLSYGYDLYFDTNRNRITTDIWIPYPENPLSGPGSSPVRHNPSLARYGEPQLIFDSNGPTSLVQSIVSETPRQFDTIYDFEYATFRVRDQRTDPNWTLRASQNDWSAPNLAQANDGQFITITPEVTLTSIAYVSGTADGERFFCLDRDTGKIWAFNRDGTECTTGVTKPLLSAITVSGRPIPGFTPLKLDYNVRMSQFPIFYQAPGRFGIRGIPLRPRERESSPGCFWLAPYVFGRTYNCTITVTSEFGGASTVYTVALFNNIEDKDLDGGSQPPPPKPDPTLDTEIRVSPPEVRAGEDAVLTWSTNLEGATVAVTQGATTISTDPSGSQTVSHASDGSYTYKIVATLGDKTDTETAVLKVVPKPVVAPLPVIDSFTASPEVVAVGQSTTLRWNTTNATAVTLNGTSVAVDGSALRSLSIGTHTFSLVAENSDGVAVTAVVTVGVVPVTVTKTPDAPPPTLAPARETVTVGTTAPTLTINGLQVLQGQLVTLPRQEQVRVSVRANDAVRWQVYVQNLATRDERVIISSPTRQALYTPDVVGAIRIVAWNANDVALAAQRVTTVTNAPPGTKTTARDTTTTPRPPTVVTPIKEPSGTLTISTDDVLETQSVTLRYTTQNAKTASITTSRGVVQLGQRGLPLASGFLVDTPGTTGRITYSLTVNGEEGSTPSRSTAQTTVTALPRVTSLTTDGISYSGTAPVRAQTNADEVSFYDSVTGALIKSVVVAAGATVILYDMFDGGPKARGGVSARPTKVGKHVVPQIASLAESLGIAWPTGTVRIPITHGLSTERYISPATANAQAGTVNPAIFDDFIYVEDARVATSAGDKVSFRARTNQVRSSILRTSQVNRIVTDAAVRSGMRSSFGAGANFSSSITGGKLASLNGLVKACATSCTISSIYARSTGNAFFQKAMRDQTVRVLTEALNGTTTNALVQRFVGDMQSSLTSQVRRLFRTLPNALSAGLGLALLIGADDASRVRIDPAALVSTVTLLDNAFDILGVSKFTGRDGVEVPWTEPKVIYTWSQGRTGNASIEAFGDTYAGGVENQTITFDDGSSYVGPNLVFSVTATRLWDQRVQDAIVWLSDRLSGPRLGALGEAEILTK